jgi:hypothetical protein
VYATLQPEAFFLRLADGGKGLAAAWAAISSLQDAIAVLNWYYAVNGVAILLLIARCARRGARAAGGVAQQHRMAGTHAAAPPPPLTRPHRRRPTRAAHARMRTPHAHCAQCCTHTHTHARAARRLLRAMDFQPRLGVVTRALQLAAPDLLHFFLVAGSVFLCYCMMVRRATPRRAARVHRGARALAGLVAAHPCPRSWPRSHACTHTRAHAHARTHTRTHTRRASSSLATACRGLPRSARPSTRASRCCWASLQT